MPYAEVDSNAKTLSDIYKDDGQSAFVSALASVTNIKITRYHSRRVMFGRKSQHFLAPALVHW